MSIREKFFKKLLFLLLTGIGLSEGLLAAHKGVPPTANIAISDNLREELNRNGLHAEAVGQAAVTGYSNGVVEIDYRSLINGEFLAAHFNRTAASLLDDMESLNREVKAMYHQAVKEGLKKAQNDTTSFRNLFNRYRQTFAENRNARFSPQLTEIDFFAVSADTVFGEVKKFVYDYDLDEGFNEQLGNYVLKEAIKARIATALSTTKMELFRIAGHILDELFANHRLSMSLVTGTSMDDHGVWDALKSIYGGDWRSSVLGQFGPTAISSIVAVPIAMDMEKITVKIRFPTVNVQKDTRPLLHVVPLGWFDNKRKTYNLPIIHNDFLLPTDCESVDCLLPVDLSRNHFIGALEIVVEMRQDQLPCELAHVDHCRAQVIEAGEKFTLVRAVLRDYVVASNEPKLLVFYHTNVNKSHYELVKSPVFVARVPVGAQMIIGRTSKFSAVASGDFDEEINFIDEDVAVDFSTGFNYRQEESKAPWWLVLVLTLISLAVFALYLSKCCGDARFALRSWWGRQRNDRHDLPTHQELKIGD